MNQTKKSYQTPRLTVHGDASQLTQSTKVGVRTDRAFPDNTPLGVILSNLTNS